MKVRELIKALQALDKDDATVVIDDADTNWALHVTKVEQGIGRWSSLVVIAGEYGDEWDEDRPGQ